LDTEEYVRNVLGSAQEVRVNFRDSRVIFGSVVRVIGTKEDCFVVRPWGLRSTIAFRFDEVCRARPVKQMGWQHQRRICETQVAELTNGPSGVEGPLERSR
jgi:hypothetical protein